MGQRLQPLLGVAMILGAVACYAVAVIWMRARFSDLPPTGMMAVVCAAEGPPFYRRCLLKKSIVRCHASFAAASS